MLLSVAARHAVADSLINAAVLIGDTDLADTPVLMFLTDRPTKGPDPFQHEMTVTPLTLSRLTRSSGTGYASVAAGIATHLHTPHLRHRLHAATRDTCPDARVLAWAVAYTEVLDHGTWAPPAMRIDAVDLDECTYRFHRSKDSRLASMSLRHLPSDTRHAPILPALAALVRAGGHRPPPGSTGSTR